MLQALRAEATAGWDSAGSLRYILSQQRTDGSLDSSVPLTAAAGWVLAGRSLLQVTDTPCHRQTSDSAPTNAGEQPMRVGELNIFGGGRGGVCTVYCIMCGCFFFGWDS